MIERPEGSFRTGRWVGLLLVTAGILVVITIPPAVSLPWRMVIMKAFAPVCHQLPTRSFHVGDIAFAVCHRCYGIYMGLFAGVLVLTATRLWLSQRWLVIGTFVFLIIMGLDWSLSVLGIRDNTLISRLVTGFFFGFLAGGLLGRVVSVHETHLPVGQNEFHARKFV